MLPSMSRAAGRSFAQFFPQAPAVVQEKKRLARERQRSTAASEDVPSLQPGASSDALRHASDSPNQQLNSTQPKVNGSSGQDEKASPRDEAGDLLNGVGSASSRTSAHSSVFSHNGTTGTQTHNGTGASATDLTPATTHGSSPPENESSPHHEKPTLSPHHVSGSGLEYSPISPNSHLHTRAATPSFQPSPTTPQNASTARPSARPAPSEVKGRKCVFDPELVDKRDTRRKMPPQYREFGQDVSLAIWSSNSQSLIYN